MIEGEAPMNEINDLKKGLEGFGWARIAIQTVCHV
jgi:hypothetical protein